MDANTAQNAIYLAASGVLGALISQGFGFARSRSEAGDKRSQQQEQRIDGLLIKHGEMSARLETMAGELGAVKAEVRILTQHRDELEVKLAEALKEQARCLAALTLAEDQVGRLTSHNAELLLDLEEAQRQATEAEKKVADLTQELQDFRDELTKK